VWQEDPSKAQSTANLEPSILICKELIFCIILCTKRKDKQKCQLTYWHEWNTTSKI